MTLEEIAVVVAEQTHRQFDPAFLEMIEKIIPLWRAKIIRQRLQERRNERDYFTLPLILKTQLVSESECEQLGIAGECIYRTVDIVPTIVRTDVLFDYVGAINFRNPFGKLDSLRLHYKEFSRTKHEPSFDYRQYIYLYNSTAPAIGVRAIWENPVDINLCNNKNQTVACNESEYNCPSDVLTDVIEAMKTSVLKRDNMTSKEQVKSVNEI